MKRSLVLILGLLVVYGCGKKTEQVQISGWEQYEEPYSKISVTYPQGWLLQQEGTKLTFYSDQELVTRFLDYSGEGKDGGRIIVSQQKMDSLEALENYVASLKRDLINAGYDIESEESAQLDGIPSTKLVFGGYIDKDTKIEATQITAIRDSFMYMIKLEAFNVFTPLIAVLDTAVASVTFPAPKTAEQQEDPSIPSTTLVTFENDYLKISYPDNFEPEMPTPKEPSEFSLQIKGYRLDCSVQIDIIPAQGLAPEKVVEQNAKFYRETSRGESIIDGVSATYLNYSMVRGIQSRVYFLVKNDKFYRIIVNYFSQMRDVYLPVFEKVAGSIQTKEVAVQ